MRVVYIFPYRNTEGQDRDAQLEECKEMLELMCVKRGLAFECMVGEHLEDGNKFNRGQCLNVCVNVMVERGDNLSEVMLVLHDVDLIPSGEYFEKVYVPLYEGRVQLSHLASAWPRYGYETFLGGVLAIRGDLFLRVGGMPAQFYGWGGEDDAFYIRLSKERLIERMEPKEAKSQYAFVDLERFGRFRTAEYKRSVDKKEWMNMDKRKNIQEEVAQTQSGRVLWREAVSGIRVQSMVQEKGGIRISFECK